MEATIPARTPTTVLACRAGRYDEAPPLALLRPHFQCVWTNTISAHHSGRIAVPPDGCVDILWRDKRFVVAGPDVTAAHPDLQPGTTVLGIRFMPGAAANWLGLPITEIVGSEIPMDYLWGPRAHALADKIGTAATVREQLAALQQVLLDELPSIPAPVPDAAAIFRTLAHHTGSGDSRIAFLRDQLDVSERTLRRRAGELFGYGPKTLDRILRFQRFQALASADAREGLAGLALRAGYADQAHLGREIQSLCQMTAGELLAQLKD